MLHHGCLTGSWLHLWKFPAKYFKLYEDWERVNKIAKPIRLLEKWFLEAFFKNIHW